MLKPVCRTNKSLPYSENKWPRSWVVTFLEYILQVGLTE